MFMLLFFLCVGIYFIVRGGTEAGLWAGNSILQGVLLMLAGGCLVLAQLLH